MKWVWAAIAVQAAAIVWEGVEASATGVAHAAHIPLSQWISGVGIVAALAAALRLRGAARPIPAWLAYSIVGCAAAELAGWVWDNLGFHAFGKEHPIQVVPHLLMQLGFLALLLFSVIATAVAYRNRKRARKDAYTGAA